jgi:transposase
MARKSSSSTFQQWVREFRETGNAIFMGVMPQPSSDATDEELRQLWELSAANRRFWRSVEKHKAKIRAAAKERCDSHTDPSPFYHHEVGQPEKKEEKQKPAAEE